MKTTFAMITAVLTALTVVSSPVAQAAIHAPAPQSTTPYLDQIESAVRNVSPGLEHQVWERTHGNLLDSSGGDWLLQTPQCWGRDPCPLADRTGTTRLLNKITANIGAATSTVDITSLGCPEKLIVQLPSPCRTYPDGAFRDAIVAGLSALQAPTPPSLVRPSV